MDIRETYLPGIGKKFQIKSRGGDVLIVVVHDDGRRECYMEADRDNDFKPVFSLDDDEARMLASIVGGMQYKPRALENIEMVLDDLIIEWYRVEPTYKSVGSSIGQLGVRNRSGASVLAVVEKGGATKHINPGPDLVLTEEALLIVAGERSQQKAFRDILKNGCE
ncbi:cation:proton antiporter regulatory subunit [Paenibacillus pasadenensis]|uniref:TrkA domain protein n=1 Tax=Paenibacillus pasadenensis TaxID=217090 RepID=A0A2N5N2D2_9BACL|nr:MULTISPECIES: TrkA C-terminal domain-containing protein [Paenibacillus]PLT44482.1 trkA domain protein [Paenibacillus pasadenensis]QGG54955.1 potassium:proton antiporter [Paenibacillus sp. B01]